MNFRLRRKDMIDLSRLVNGTFQSNSRRKLLGLRVLEWIRSPVGYRPRSTSCRVVSTGVPTLLPDVVPTRHDLDRSVTKDKWTGK